MKTRSSFSGSTILLPLLRWTEQSEGWGVEGEGVGGEACLVRGGGWTTGRDKLKANTLLVNQFWDCGCEWLLNIYTVLRKNESDTRDVGMWMSLTSRCLGGSCGHWRTGSPQRSPCSGSYWSDPGACQGTGRAPWYLRGEKKRRTQDGGEGGGKQQSKME